MGNLWKWFNLNYVVFAVFLFLYGCGGNSFIPNTQETPPYTGETCMSANAVLLGLGGEYTIDAADFDGTNDYMLRGGGLTGAADSKTGIFSGWIRVDGGADTERSIIRTTAPNQFSVYLSQVDNKLYVVGFNVSGTIILGVGTSVINPSAAWVHILASWDLATGDTHMYVDDVSDNNTTDNANDTIDYTLPDWGIGAYITGLSKMDGCLADIYLAPGQYLDFSVVANRRKFISATGKPVNLSVDGSLPTGTAPLIYQHLDDGEAVANFATNAGSGGNFSITGTLTTASTSPSD